MKSSNQAKTRLELDTLHASTREAMEGLRPGRYVRLMLTRAPCELVNNFDPTVPLLIGGITQVGLPFSHVNMIKKIFS